jgi:hypothetical protein
MPKTSATSSVTVSFFSALCLMATSLFAGLLVWVSFLFEVRAYSALLGPVGTMQVLWGYDLAHCLAFGLNGAKIMLIYIIAQAVLSHRGKAFVLKGLRGVVLSLSLLMTLLVFSGQTISPNADQQLVQARAQVDADLRAALADVDRRHEARILAQQEALDAEIDRVTAAHQALQADLRSQYDRERGIGGQAFRGARYEELERLIAEDIARTTARIDELRAEAAATQLIAEVERDNRRETLTARHAERRDSIHLRTIFDSPEAQHPTMMRFVELTSSVLPEGWGTTLNMTLFLAFLVSLVVELLPMAMFGHVFGVLARASEAGAMPQSASQVSAEAENSTLTQANDPETVVEQSSPDQGESPASAKADFIRKVA